MAINLLTPCISTSAFLINFWHFVNVEGSLIDSSNFLEGNCPLSVLPGRPWRRPCRSKSPLFLIPRERRSRRRKNYEKLIFVAARETYGVPELLLFIASLRLVFCLALCSGNTVGARAPIKKNCPRKTPAPRPSVTFVLPPRSFSPPRRQINLRIK